MDVELAERRQERVRVVELDVQPVRVGDVEPVARAAARPGTSPAKTPAGWQPLELDRLAALGQHADPLGVGPERAHDDVLAAVRMRTEQVVRVRVVSPDDAARLRPRPSRVCLLE